MVLAVPLTAATYLGDNTAPILRDLIAYLSAVTGIEIAIDPTAPRTSSDAGVHAADVDLIWMCGCLTMSLLSTATIPHDIVAAPVFAGHGKPVYHSVIIAHADGPPSLAASLGTRLAVNEPGSWSGHHGLKAHVAGAFPGEWFTDDQTTGAHRASIAAVVNRTCDVAAIDVTVWNHIAATEPTAVADLRIIDRTIDWPAPPISLDSNLDPDQRAAIESALRAIGPGVIASLDGIVATDSRPYETMSIRQLTGP